MAKIIVTRVYDMAVVDEKTREELINTFFNIEHYLDSFIESIEIKDFPED